MEDVMELLIQDKVRAEIPTIPRVFCESIIEGDEVKIFCHVDYDKREERFVPETLAELFNMQEIRFQEYQMGKIRGE